MEIVDAQARRVLAEVVDHARTETGWLLFHVALTGAVVWLAVHGIDGVPSVLFWVLAGAVGSDALNSVGSTVSAWREHRRLRSLARTGRLSGGAL